VDVEIPMGLGCRIAIFSNSEGVISLIQRASLEILIGILLNSYANSSIQKGPKPSDSQFWKGLMKVKIAFFTQALS
jgi:hypothetical protein